MSSPHQNKEKDIYQYMPANAYNSMYSTQVRRKLILKMFICGDTHSPNVCGSNRT
jgi:hypothetical protein